MTQSPFEFLLFSTKPERIVPAVSAGITGVIVDWESLGKEDRQLGADTQINHDTLEDLRRVRACTAAKVICRINRFGRHSAGEIEQAVQAGVDDILLPMVTSVEEVENALQLAGGRCGVGILVETMAAVQAASELAKLPLSRVYVGLNDLGIERRTPNIFTAVIDGTVEAIRQHFPVPFGFGGLTVPERGFPIPCRLLIAEMARLNCSFSFLRRSFQRDVPDQLLEQAVPSIHAALADARLRTPEQIIQDQLDLQRFVEAWVPQPG
jgi:hypothetical protein